VEGGVGVGATDHGDLLDSCGTSEALIRMLRADLPSDAMADAVESGISVGRHMFPGTLQIMAGLRSGLGLWRFLKLMRVAPEELPRLDKEALAVEPGPGSPVVDGIWTELAGLRNIGYEPEPAQIWRAAVEAVQVRAAEVKELLEAVAGPTRRIIATGGGLNSEAVRVLKRRILGEYDAPDVGEAGARGAAVFAAVAAGVIEGPDALRPPRDPVHDLTSEKGRM
jgi:sugar (pentulose or hexulose) kinase